VTTASNQPPDQQVIEQTRKKVNLLFEEVGRLTEQDIRPAEFYAEFLQRVLDGLQAAAGAVWVCTAQGNLQLQHQINLRQMGIDATEEAKQGHSELLRQSLRSGRPLLVPPQSGTGASEKGAPAANNPTPYLILLAPVLVDQQVTALVEIWQYPHRHPDAASGYLRFLTDMAQLASLYTRNYLRRQMTGQQHLWTQLEVFARQIHGSLNPVEVAYQIANEGRRLIECDRVSVAVRYGKRTRIEAVSGTDVVERRSNLVRLMRRLSERVLDWGEKLVYTGTKDEALPPKVLSALDAYLAESNSKLLVVAPLRDEREAESKKPARSALVMEAFDPPANPEQFLARLDVIGKHAAPALYNAVEYRRIPFRWVWLPIAKLQEGLGGKARMISAAVVAGLSFLITMLCIVPYQLKVESNGKLLPVIRQYGYSPIPGRVEQFLVKPNDVVKENQPLVLMFDRELQSEILKLEDEIAAAKDQVDLHEKQLNANKSDLSQEAKYKIGLELVTQRSTLLARTKELDQRRKLTHSRDNAPGYFEVWSPSFPEGCNVPQDQRLWTILSADFQENLTSRYVRPSDPLLRMGYRTRDTGDWEVELKIPQKHIAQVLYGFDWQNKDEVGVSLLLRSDPTHSYKGKLSRDRIGGEALEHRDDNNESEPQVTAYVRISGDDIPDSDRLPPDVLVTGTEVHAKVHCGKHAMGYSLFYGVWEFLYEKVVFSLF
jgi:hypothetical protein